MFFFNLRTVIVTAAVYWGFGSTLRLPGRFPSPFQPRAVIRPYTSSCDFAESCVFSKQSQPPFLCNRSTLRARSSSREPAHLLPKLRCHFAEFLNQGSLTRLGIL